MSSVFRRFKSNIFLLSCFEFFFCAYLAAYYSFLFIFLQSKGFRSSTIGLIFAVSAFVTIFSQPFWGIISDKLQNIKKVFIICLIVTTSLYQLLYFCNNHLLIGSMLALINFFLGPLSPLVDSWIIQNVSREKNLGYGNIRIWGCIGFALTSYFLGRNIVLSSINIVFPTFAVLAIITAGFCIAIKNERSTLSLAFKDLKIGRLFKNYNYSTFLIYATLFCIPIISCETFFTQLLKSMGGNEESLGLAYAVCSLSEVPIFFLSTYLLRKHKPLKLILFASCLYILRQYLYLVSFQPIHLIFLQILQGICFGIFLSSTLYYIDSMAPIELKATSQTVFGALYYGITGIAGNYLGGFYIEKIGLSSMYKMSFILSLGVFIIFNISLQLKKMFNKKNDNFL